MAAGGQWTGGDQCGSRDARGEAKQSCLRRLGILGVREILFGSDQKEPFSLSQASLVLLSEHHRLSQGVTASPVRGVESEHTVGSQLPKKNIVL